jgi:hypothetical protein
MHLSNVYPSPTEQHKHYYTNIIAKEIMDYIGLMVKQHGTRFGSVLESFEIRIRERASERIKIRSCGGGCHRQLAGDLFYLGAQIRSLETLTYYNQVHNSKASDQWGASSPSSLGGGHLLAK